MQRAPLLAVAAATLALLAGCAGFPDAGPTTAAGGDVEPAVVDFVSSGGACVTAPTHDWNVTQETASGSTVVRVSGNVTVPDANYALEPPTLARLGPGRYLLSVTSEVEPKKPARNCTAQAGYTATIRLPPSEEGRLTVRHDGVNVTGVGWGAVG